MPQRNSLGALLLLLHHHLLAAFLIVAVPEMQPQFAGGAAHSLVDRFGLAFVLLADPPGEPGGMAVDDPLPGAAKRENP